MTAGKLEVVEAVLSGSVAALVSGVSAYFSMKAASNSKPVSNGFTGHVMTELRYLRSRLDTHMEHHETQ